MIDQYLAHIKTVNGHRHINAPYQPMAEDMPQELHITSTSDPDTSFMSMTDRETTSDNNSCDSIQFVFSTASTTNMQLQPCNPISYEIYLSKRKGHPQIKTLNNLSIPLPTDEDSNISDP